MAYKAKVITSRSPDELEKELTKWLKEAGGIHITNLAQSQSREVEGTGITLTVFYYGASEGVGSNPKAAEPTQKRSGTKIPHSGAANDGQ
jgi:hypothetical protein